MNNDLNQFLNVFWLIAFFMLLFLIVIFITMILPSLVIIIIFTYFINYTYARILYSKDRKAALAKLKEVREAARKNYYVSCIKSKRLTWIKKGYEAGIEAARGKRWEAARKRGIAERRKNEVAKR